MRKIFDSPRVAAALVAALALGNASLSIVSAQAQSLEAIRQAGRLRITVHGDYKPWSWRELGEMKGIDVDIGAALARGLGVKADDLDLRADADINDDLGAGVWLGSFPGDVMLHVPFDRRIEAGNDQIKLVAPYDTQGLAMAVDPSKAEQARDFALFETDKVAVEVGVMADVILLSARDHKLIDHVVHVRGVAKAAEAYDRGESPPFTARPRLSISPTRFRRRLHHPSAICARGRVDALRGRRRRRARAWRGDRRGYRRDRAFFGRNATHLRGLWRPLAPSGARERPRLGSRVVTPASPGNSNC